ncbi:hypothetical protein PRNP1_004725 [Phytophthora ramorum]
MKFTLPEDAFPDVNLSKQHQEALIAEADTIIRETIAANEEFLADGETLKDQSWRLVRTKDGLKVYHQRRPSTGSSRKSSKSQKSGSFTLDSQLASLSTNPTSSGQKHHLEASDEEVSVSSSASDKTGPSKVTKYCRSFSNPKGKIPDRVAVTVTADSLICAAKVVDYAYIKKLTWFMKHERQSQRQTETSRPKCCAVCNKSFAKFGFTAAGYGASCQICHRALCSKCNITKKMTVDVSGTGAVKQVALRFCLGCVREAKAKSVWEMALSGVETSSEASSTSGSARSGPLR